MGSRDDYPRLYKARGEAQHLRFRCMGRWRNFWLQIRRGTLARRLLSDRLARVSCPRSTAVCGARLSRSTRHRDDDVGARHRNACTQTLNADKVRKCKKIHRSENLLYNWNSLIDP